jgi:transposase-like protein
MRENIIKSTDSSTAVVYGCLEEMVRQQAQSLIQRVLEEEVESLLGRRKHERKPEVDAPSGYRNGYGKARKLAMTSGTVTIRRPRVKGLEERFESRVLPLFVRRTAEVGNLLPELYLHGLSQGDFELALRGLLGDGAPLSASSIARLKEKWHADKIAWDERSLADLDIVYLWVDGVYVKAGLEKEKACVFVAVAGLADGRKVIVALTAGHRESTTSWESFLRNLKTRGMRDPRLVCGDGNLGIWGAVTGVFPEAEEQRCWNHRIVNVLDKLPKKLQGDGKELLKVIPYAETEYLAEVAKKRFKAWAIEKGQKDAANLIEKDWERMVTFYRFPTEHWRHLRTSNIVESPFATLRLRTDAAKRFKKVDNATAVVWKMLLVAEKSFRKLNAPHLMALVYAGAKCKDGVVIREETKGKAA